MSRAKFNWLKVVFLLVSSSNPLRDGFFFLYIRSELLRKRKRLENKIVLIQRTGKEHVLKYYLIGFYFLELYCILAALFCYLGKNILDLNFSVTK